MCTLSKLAVELLLDIFDYFDIGTILSLRQLNSEWKLFVDGEDVSRYLIDARLFTFRGTLFTKQPEVIRRLHDDKYQTTMKHLSSRLRGLSLEGPVLVWSLPHPEDYKFCFGGRILALEKHQGQQVEIIDAFSRKLMYEIRLCHDLGDSPSGNHGRKILGMRIRADVLLISVMEIEHDGKGISDGLSHFLFYRLAAKECSLLLKVSRERSHFNAQHTFRLCDFNGTLAAMGTLYYLSPPKYYILEVWSLATGELKAREIRLEKDVRALCVTSDKEWSVLCALRQTKTKLGVPAANIYWIKTFSGDGVLMNDILFDLQSFPSDCFSSETWLEERSLVTFGIHQWSDSWLIVWKELKTDGKLRLFVLNRPTGHPISRRLITFGHPSLIDGIYVNIEAGYCLGLEQSPNSDHKGTLFYASFHNLNSRGFTVLEDRYDKSSKPVANGPDLVWIEKDEVVFENKVNCERCFTCGSGNVERTREKPSSIESFHWFGSHGDDEGVLRRVGDYLEMYRFDTCQVFNRIQRE